MMFEEQKDETSGRYRMLETIRQYAMEKLQASGEATAVRERHLEYLMGWAEQSEPKLHGPEQTFWLDCLEREHDNFRAALAGSLEEGKWQERGLQLAGALFWFWHLRSYFREGRQWLDRLLERTAGLGRTRARARALQGAGQLRHYLGERAMERAQLEECAAISRELGDERGYAYATIYLSFSISEVEQGNPVTARALAEEGVGIMRSLGDRWGLGMTLWCLGFNILFYRDAAEACPLLEESVALLRQVGDNWAIAAPLYYLGWAHWDLGDYPAARSLTLESCAFARTAGDRWRVAMHSFHLGGWARKQGDYPVALSCLQESVRLFHEVNDERSVANTLESFALLAVAQARSGRAHAEVEMSRAACLLGAAETLRAAIQVALPASDREEVDRALAATEEVLGEEALTAARNEGRAMTLKQAVAYALGAEQQS